MNNNFILSAKINREEIPVNSYIKEIKAIANLRELNFEKNITFFVGENGTGKSTLLEGIAVAFGFNPEGGTKNFMFSTKDTHSPLKDALTLVKGISRPRDGYFLRAESFYNLATQIDEYEKDIPGYLEYYGGKSLHEQSHGESFLSLIQNKFQGKGLYILDEPESALSPQRQLTLLYTIHELAKQGAQFIIATHSPILLGTPGAAIISFDNGEIQEISYEETESYKITEMFINQRERLLNKLLD
ncbi:MAG: ABC transporter ATP-binding protein [Clostridia bacterium]|jgi:predicted ATPase|nr:ABC transporter ATP-binding protein [Clostridia bacterium]